MRRSARQYTFIREYIDQKGYAPNVREIGRGCGMGQSTAYHHLKRLESAGKLQRTWRLARSIVVVDEATRPDDE